MPHHDEGVSGPQAGPVGGAAWWLSGVGVMHGHGSRGRLTHHTATDVLLDGISSEWMVWMRLHRRQPIGFVVSTGVFALFGLADGERQGGEHGNAGTGLTWEHAGESDHCAAAWTR